MSARRPLWNCPLTPRAAQPDRTSINRKSIVVETSLAGTKCISPNLFNVCQALCQDLSVPGRLKRNRAIGTALQNRMTRPIGCQWEHISLAAACAKLRDTADALRPIEFIFAPNRPSLRAYGLNKMADRMRQGFS